LFTGQDGGVLILREWRKPFCTHSLSSFGAITIIIITTINYYYIIIINKLKKTLLLLKKTINLIWRVKLKNIKTKNKIKNKRTEFKNIIYINSNWRAKL